MRAHGFDQTIGRRIARARKAARLTQAELADRLQIPLDTYRHYEYGRRSITVGMLQAIATALQLAPVSLLIDDPHLCTALTTVTAHPELAALLTNVQALPILLRLVHYPDVVAQVSFFLDTLDDA